MYYKNKVNNRGKKEKEEKKMEKQKGSSKVFLKLLEKV